MTLFILVVILVFIVIWYQTNYISPRECSPLPGAYFTALDQTYSGIKQTRRVNDLASAQDYCTSQGDQCLAFVWNPQTLRMHIVQEFSEQNNTNGTTTPDQPPGIFLIRHGS